MNFCRERFDVGQGFIDGNSNFLSWGKARVAQPVVTYHSVFIRVCDRSGFKLVHGIERLGQAGTHLLDEFLGEIHAADVYTKINRGKFGVVFFESFPELFAVELRHIGSTWTAAEMAEQVNRT